MSLYKITKVLLNNRTYLINLLEYQRIGINIELNKTSCEIDKFFLTNEKNKLDNIEEKLHIGILNTEEIDEIIKNIHKSYKQKL